MWAVGKVATSPCTRPTAQLRLRTLPGTNGRRDLRLGLLRKVQRQRVSSVADEGKDQPSSSNGSVSVGSVEPLAAVVASTSAEASAPKPARSSTPVPDPASPAKADAAETTATSSKPSEAESHPVDVPTTLEEEADMFATKELIQELTDTSKLGKRGEGWFVAQLLVFAMVIFPPMKLNGLVDLLSILSISAGIVFMAYAVYSIGRSLSPVPEPRKKGQLVTTGMYGYVRHPMYAGLLLVSFGLTFLTGSETRFALSFILWWVLDQKAKLEEKLLLQAYPEYAEYQTRVHKFIPYLY